GRTRSQRSALLARPTWRGSTTISRMPRLRASTTAVAWVRRGELGVVAPRSITPPPPLSRMAPPAPPPAPPPPHVCWVARARPPPHPPRGVLDICVPHALAPPS